MSVLFASMHNARPPVVLHGDLDEAAFRQALQTEAVALDIETTGLDWRCERIGTVQVAIADSIYVIRADGLPYRLKAVVEDASIRKVLHHAMFDLRFLAHHWDIVPAHIACTKIASKLAEPEVPREEHSLAPLLRRYLGVSLDKTQQRSEWTGELSSEQINYAAEDVRYLLALYDCLDEKLKDGGLTDLRDRCYAHLPTQVELEVAGFPDVFAY